MNEIFEEHNKGWSFKAFTTWRWQ